MAYQNESYTSLSYTGDEYTVLGSYVPPGAGHYVGSSYTNERYTASGYTSLVPDLGGGFIGTGLAADNDVQGFAGGFPFTNAGTGAAVGNNTGWTGFSPDPGGILENDFSDEGPLSYTVLTLPEAGTLYPYVGGAFTWDVTPSTPVGRYTWTYGLYVNGVQEDIGTVTMEHGDVYASVDVQGFAGSVITSSGFVDGGLRASVVPTGFSGSLFLNFVGTGTGAETESLGYGGGLTAGQSLRGTSADCDVEGFAGFLLGDFVQAGTAATVEVQGFAGTLNVGTFFSDAGTAGDVDVTGFAGTLITGQFTGQGTSGDVDAQGNYGTILYGFAPRGTAAEVNVTGFAGEFLPFLSDQHTLHFSSVTNEIIFESASNEILFNRESRQSVVTPTPIEEYILLESGDYLLLTDDGRVIRADS